MDKSNSMELAFRAVKITSTPTAWPGSTSTSSREPSYLASRRRRSQSSSSISPPAKRKRRYSSNLSSTRSSVVSSGMDPISKNTNQSSSDSDESHFIQIGKGRKVKMVGQAYLLFRPKSKKGLYAQIIENSPNLENVVNSWIRLYNSSRNDGMNILLNLLINVMGYQNVDMEYTAQLDYAVLRMHLEQNTNKLQGKLICLFRSKSPFAKTFIAACFSFFQHLIHACDQANILYESTFYNPLLSFITEMCKSSNRIIIVTMCSIGMKLCTYFISVFKRIQNNMDASGSSHSSVIFQHSECLKQIIERLSATVLHYCTIPDYKLYMLRMRYAEELGAWIEKCPEFFITDQIFNKLRKLVFDEKTSVRIIALKSCNVIVGKEKCEPYIAANQSGFWKLYNTVATRLNDRNADVVIMAVKFFLKSSNLYPEMLNVDMQKKIFSKLYSYNYKLARECGLFCLATILGGERQQMIKNIITLDQLPQYKRFTAVLVHTLIGCSPEFCDIKYLIDLITTANEVLTSDEMVKLLEIIYHTCNILVNGIVGYRRSQTSVDVDTNRINEYIGGVLLTNITCLLGYFYEEEDSLDWILKTLNILDFSQPNFSKYREDIKTMAKYLIAIMRNTLNKTILSLCSEILSKLSEENCLYSRQYYASFLIYLDQLILEYQENVYLNRQKTILEQDYINVRNGIYILSIICEHHNCLQILDWLDIYSNWGSGNITNEIIKYQIICCQRYLKWELNAVMEPNEEDSTNILCLKQHIEVFLTSSAEVLKTTKSESLHISTYLSICDFFLHFNKIKTQPRAYRLIEILEVSMANFGDLDDSLSSFVMKHCFDVDSDTLLSRKTYLIKYVTLIMNGELPIKKIISVMKYHHLYKHQYKSIYTCIFDKLKRVNKRQISICIFKTLLNAFFTNEKPNIIKTLSMDFTNINSRSSHYYMIKMGIRFIIEYKARVSFILVLKPFVKKFSRKDRIEMLEYIKLNCPAEFYKDKAFNLFLESLKVKNGSDTLVHQVRESERSSTRSTRTQVSYSECSDEDVITDSNDD